MWLFLESKRRGSGFTCEFSHHVVALRAPNTLGLRSRVGVIAMSQITPSVGRDDSATFCELLPDRESLADS